MFKCLYNFDFIGPFPEFQINGFSRYTSRIGVVFSLLTIIATVYIIKDTLFSIIYNINPIMLEEKSHVSVSNFTNTEFKFFITLNYINESNLSFNFLKTNEHQPPKFSITTQIYLREKTNLS